MIPRRAHAFSQRYRFTRAPAGLHRCGIKRDNIALVPASLLPFKSQWQKVANDLPAGGVLLCARSTNGRLRRILARVAAHLKTKGYRVTTLPAERFV